MRHVLLDSALLAVWAFMSGLSTGITGKHRSIFTFGCVIASSIRNDKAFCSTMSRLSTLKATDSGLLWEKQRE